MDQIARIIEGSKPGFLVWSGNDNETFYIMSMGGFGVVSVASHLIGDQIKHMMGLLLEGDVEQAGAEHRRLLPAFKVLFTESNPIPVKHGLNQAGFNVGNPRLPLVPASERAAAQIDEVMSQYHIDLPV
jgi:4-hydroxy-tetrahydrodipicolinate synthase